jgi:hypothetical protein
MPSTFRLEPTANLGGASALDVSKPGLTRAGIRALATALAASARSDASAASLVIEIHRKRDSMRSLT